MLTLFALSNLWMARRRLTAAAPAMGLKEPVAGRQADKKAVWTAKSEEKRIFQDSNVDVDGLAALSARLFRASLMTTSAALQPWP